MAVLHTITVHLPTDSTELDEGMLTAATRAARRQMREDRDTHVDIYADQRLPSGWLEYIVRVRDGMTIGVIQREPGAEYEAHS